MNNRFKFRIAVYERQQNNMHWEFIEYIDPSNQHWGLNQCGDIISDHSYSAHYTRKNAPDSVHRVYEPEQCTGLKDKNGNLIYEEDILQNPNKDQYIVEWIVDGYWHIRQIDDEKFGCALASIKTLYDGWEIIGNVHQTSKIKG